MNIDLESVIDRVCRVAKSRANSGLWDGTTGPTRYFESCRHCFATSPETGCLFLFTRDVGHHACGWWKNPDYERCYHLSISHYVVGSHERLPRNVVVNRMLIDRVYDTHQDKLWAEPPYSDEGKRNDVWHYRLFCDAAWSPILPRGEVYSKEFTEQGWLSWSDAKAADHAFQTRKTEILLNARAA